jgi:cob(I)alamin adenosyltransferase
MCILSARNYNAGMNFYTRKGDDGTTGLLEQGRVTKIDARIEAIGDLDEASAALGLARSSAADPRAAALLLEVQRDLYQVMAEVAASPGRAASHPFDAQRVMWLEQQIDRLSGEVEMPAEFIVPGDSPGGAAEALARAIVRRAERRIVGLAHKRQVSNPALQQYLNRLSSLLFVLELVENHAAGQASTRARR